MILTRRDSELAAAAVPSFDLLEAVEPSLTWLEPKEILIPRTIALCHPRRRDPSASALTLMAAVQSQFGT